MSKWLTSAAVAVALALPVLPASAAQYDGRWVIDFPSTGVAGNNQNPACAAVRIVASVANDQIAGSLARSDNSPTEVTDSAGPGASPLTGTIAPDGTVSATWQGYEITGKLAGDGGIINVTGECGPRVGKALRVTD